MTLTELRHEYPHLFYRNQELSGPFWSKVRPDVSGCWLWTGMVAETGYGRWVYSSRPPYYVYAHRHAYTTLVAPIPVGHDVHHLCKNKKCVRPDHLQAVTRWQHVRLDATNIMGQKAAQTACAHGHPYTPENTGTSSQGRRFCRTCKRAADRDLAARKRKAR